MTRALPVLAALGLAAACAPALDLELDPGAGGAPPGGSCRPSLAPRDVQGRAPASPLLGQVVAVGGVATLSVELAPGRPGFFLQSSEPDADPLSAEALFVAWDGPAPATGTRVRARGRVSELDGMTALDGVEQLDECGTERVAPVALDVRELDDPEAWEGLWVTARGDWSLVEVRGSAATVSASPHGRVYASGHALGGGAPPELWAVRARDAAPAAPGEPSLRLGAALRELEGVLWVEGASRQLLAREPPPWPAQVPAPPARPPGSGLRLVGLNLHGYFVSLDGRGASSEEELARQRDALVAAIVALDADILALTELENRGAESLRHLLDGLDRALPSDRRYAFEEAGAPSRGVLRAGVAFRPSRVRARGPAWFSSEPGFRRPPLFQSFESQGWSFSLGVVHLSSKRCDGAPSVVSSEGCGAEARRSEAALLLEAAGALAARSPREPLLLMGDFNADEREAPLRLLASGGYGGLLAALPAPDRYSYVYEGRASLLDHALARAEFLPHVGASAIWHINADEPFGARAAREGAAPAARGCSDHDPIVIDLHPGGLRPSGL